MKLKIIQEIRKLMKARIFKNLKWWNKMLKRVE